MTQNICLAAKKASTQDVSETRAATGNNPSVTTAAVKAFYWGELNITMCLIRFLVRVISSIFFDP